MGARLRRLRDGPGPRRRCGPCRGTRRPRCAWPTCAGPAGSRWSRRRGRSCAPSWSGWRERGLEAFAGTELEFIVFKDTYEEAFEKGYRDLKPANQYNVDYSLLGTARVEKLIGRIRREMTAAGLVVENSKGECNDGQHEINFHYGPALQTADEHVIYKTGRRRSPRWRAWSITFMAKFNEREGSSCHIHMSVKGLDEAALRPLRRGPARLPAGADAAVRAEHQLLQALRGRRRSRPPRWPGGTTTARARSACCTNRFELRLPGADVNPYLALSAMIAAGLHGLDAELELEEPTPGNAYVADKPHVPTTLLEARELFAASEVARAAFGEEVVAHYLNNADVELAAFEAAVTDWERVRGFERL